MLLIMFLVMVVAVLVVFFLTFTSSFSGSNNARWYKAYIAVMLGVGAYLFYTSWSQYPIQTMKVACMCGLGPGMIGGAAAATIFWVLERRLKVSYRH